MSAAHIFLGTMLVLLLSERAFALQRGPNASKTAGPFGIVETIHHEKEELAEVCRRLHEERGTSSSPADDNDMTVISDDWRTQFLADSQLLERAERVATSEWHDDAKIWSPYLLPAFQKVHRLKLDEQCSGKISSYPTTVESELLVLRAALLGFVFDERCTDVETATSSSLVSFLDRASRFLDLDTLLPGFENVFPIMPRPNGERTRDNWTLLATGRAIAELLGGLQLQVQDELARQDARGFWPVPSERLNIETSVWETALRALGVEFRYVEDEDGEFFPVIPAVKMPATSMRVISSPSPHDMIFLVPVQHISDTISLRIFHPSLSST